MRRFWTGKRPDSDNTAAQRAVLEDIERSLRAGLTQIFTPMRIHSLITEPPDGVGGMGIVFHLGDSPNKAMPPNMRAQLEAFLTAARSVAAEVVPSVPLAWELTPGTNGFVCRIIDPSTAAAYPRFVRAQAVLRPSDHVRRRMLAGV